MSYDIQRVWEKKSVIVNIASNIKLYIYILLHLFLS